MDLTEPEMAQATQAAQRYRKATSEREQVAEQQRDGRRVVDSPQQVQARVEHLVDTREVPKEALLAALSEDRPATRQVVFERIIAETNDLQPVSFLARGVRTARATGRISLDDRGRLVPMGTGFLVSPTLLLTNNHVLSDAGAAARAVVEFNCELDADGTPVVVALYRCDPQRLFLTDDHLDYTLIALQPGADGRPPGHEFGWNVLRSQQGKIVTGESINVVGHPMGRLKEITIRNGTLLPQLDEFLHYTTDTEPGNSGSGVYNDQWEVVALHHAGVPATGDDGAWLKADGTPWHAADGNDAVHWVANEGTRVSVLLAHVEQQPVDAAQRALLDEMASSPPRPVSGVVRAAGEGAAGGAADGRSNGALSAAAERGGLGRATGLPARRAPGDSGAHLVFVHGRSQQGKDPVRLRRGWAAGLSKGLVLAGLPVIDAADIWFPYYGDTLMTALRAQERMPVEAREAAVDPAEAYAPQDPDTRDLYASLIDEAAARAGFPPADERRESALTGLVGRLQDKLSWLANRSRLDQAVIATVFRDVAAYLDRNATRNAVLDAVAATLPTAGRVVIVSHSLGTVVAMDLLTRLPGALDVVGLVTAGSPLGMDAVFERLLINGPHRPARVGEWLNAWCPGDAVAIGCPLADHWGNRVSEVVVDNPSDRIHSIEEYLADQRVARFIGTAL